MADLRNYELPVMTALDKTWSVPVTKNLEASDKILLLEKLLPILSYNAGTGDLTITTDVETTTINIKSNDIPSYTVFGGELVYNGAASIGIYPFACLDSSGANYLSIISYWSKTTASWNPGTTAGALDTGTISANKTYYIFSIYNTATLATDIIYSLGASPLLPVGWTTFKMIGSFKTLFDVASIDKLSILSFSEFSQYAANGVPYPTNYRNDIEIVDYTSHFITFSNILCRDYTDNFNIQLRGIIKKDITKTFVAGYENGCLDVVLAANTHYFVYAISKTISTEPDIFVSPDDITTVSLPFGWIYKQIFGYGYTDSAGDFYFRYYNEVNNPLPPCHLDSINTEYVNTTTINLTVGAVRNSLNTKNIFACFEIEKTTAAWAEGDSNGALATGLTLTANTQYYVWIIGKNNQNAFDYVINTSSSVFTMPTAAVTAGYTTYKCIGAFRTAIATTNINNNTIAYKREDKWEQAVISVQNVQTTGTNGGNTVATTWTKRVLNTIKKHSIPGSTINTTTYQITLPKGFYKIEAFQMSYDVLITGRIYDVTNAVELTRFNHVDSSPANMVIGIQCSGYFKLIGDTVIELQYYAGSVVTNGLGTAMNLAGLTELYVNLDIMQIRNGE